MPLLRWDSINICNQIEVVHVRIMSMQMRSHYRNIGTQSLMQPLDVSIDVNLGVPVQVYCMRFRLALMGLYSILGVYQYIRSKYYAH